MPLTNPLIVVEQLDKSMSQMKYRTLLQRKNGILEIAQAYARYPTVQMFVDDALDDVRSLHHINRLLKECSITNWKILELLYGDDTTSNS